MKRTSVFNFILLAGVALSSSSVSAFQGNVFQTQKESRLTIAVTSGEIVAGAENFVDSVTKRGLSFLSNKNLSDSQRTREFKKLLEDSFDMNTIARFALGRYWRTISASEKKEYLKLFKDMVVNVYSDRFKEYNGQEISVVGSRAEGKKDAIVMSKISSDNGPEVSVNWRIRYRDGRYKVIDVIVEGVSMGLTQRSDFSSVIQRGGGKVSALLEHLRNT